MISGGRSFVSSPPAFSNDCKNLLVCTGNTISIFSTTTGLQITELEGHTDRVTSIVTVPPPSGQASRFMCHCWTSSLDGTICYWDFAASELIKKLNVGLPIFDMVIPGLSIPSSGSKGAQSDIFAFISVEAKKELNGLAGQNKAMRGQILVFSLTHSRRIGGLLAETRSPEHLTISNSGEFVGSLYKRKLHIWRIPKSDMKCGNVRKIKLRHTKNLTTLAIHPTERIVAGGDVTGRILIWRGVGKEKFSDNMQLVRRRAKDEEEKPGVRGNDDADSCSTYHWHPSEVKTLFFSSDGAYLISGGREGVIVVWQLDSGKKKFKSRLGSPLLFFRDSPDPSLSCISCADNQIHLLKMPSMGIIRSISGIKLPFSSPDEYEGFPSGIAIDRSSGLLALPTEDYCVQFFSLFDSREVSQVQVCERNFQPVDDVTVYVSLISLSVDGSMMATVDVKLPEDGLGGLASLKFWSRGSWIGEYSLSTVIYEPHSDAGVSALAFRPNHNMAVSSSFGGDFKVWIHSSDIQQKDQKSGWRCRSVGSYKKMSMTAAAFSADGSVLAVAAETAVTLWDPDKNVLVAIIGDTLTPIKALSFVGGSEYLVSLSQSSNPQLCVWNLSKLSMYWSYRLFAEAASSSESGSHFAVLAIVKASGGTSLKDQDGIIVLFNVEDPVPVAKWLVKKAKGGSIAFLPPNASSHGTKDMERKDPLLAYVNGDREYIVFDPFSSDSNYIGRSSWERHVRDEEPDRVGYASVYGDLPVYDSKSDQTPEIPFFPLERPWETIFSGSSHILPPLSKLCEGFLASLLEKRPGTTE